MSKQPKKWMKLYGVVLFIFFIIQSFFFWNEEKVLSYFNMISATAILIMLIAVFVKEMKQRKSRGDFI